MTAVDAFVLLCIIVFFVCLMVVINERINRYNFTKKRAKQRKKREKRQNKRDRKRAYKNLKRRFLSWLFKG